MKSARIAPALMAATLAAALAATACSDRVTSVETVFDRLESPPAEAGESATFAFVQEKVLTPTCAVSGCHNGATFPDLSAGAAYDNMVRQPSSAGLPYVEPGSPNGSFLYVKILGETDDGPALVGSRMPRGGAPLTQALIDSVAAWIQRGALRDE